MLLGYGIPENTGYSQRLPRLSRRYGRSIAPRSKGTEVDLLPCPFCGGENIVATESDFPSEVLLICADCGTAGPMSALIDGAILLRGYDENLAKAIELRNSRPGWRICCNSDCGWIGMESMCVHPHHWPEDRLCPKCNEVTEVVTQ
jgi:predicted RNA-binding Zn-ribbon protein involved in translation (DUF1610 family)